MKKQFLRSSLILIISFLFILVLSPAKVSAAGTGWQKEDGKWVYYGADGEKYAGDLYWIKDAYYYFDEDGYMQTGWIKYRTREIPKDYYDGVYYYTQTDWIYAFSNGKAAQGWNTINEKTYYFMPEMLYGGGHEIDGKMYFFDENGVYQSNPGWYELDIVRVDDVGSEAIEYGKYYCNSDGTLTVGWKKMDGQWYCFSPVDGRLFTSGVHFYQGKYYLFQDSGVWISEAGWGEYAFWNDWGHHSFRLKTMFYLNTDGSVKIGWQKIDGKWYYFDPDSGMKTGLGRVDEKLYLFLDDGVLLTQPGWNKVPIVIQYGIDQYGNEIERTYYRWYYLDEEGSPLLGWQTIGGKTYYFEVYDGTMCYSQVKCFEDQYYLFTASGALAGAGWQKLVQECFNTVDGEYTITHWYYCNLDGTVRQGLQMIDGKYYFFLGGEMLHNASIQLEDGKYYYFRENGARVDKPGWFKIVQNAVDSDGNPYISTDWVFIQDDGSIAIGWKVINNKAYFFDYGTGRIFYGGVKNIDGKYYLFRDSGACVNKPGWNKVSLSGTSSDGEAYWYYMNEDGSLKTGWQRINEKGYYFDENCRMVTGLYYLEREYYYFQPSGALASEGWQKLTDTYTTNTGKTVTDVYWLYCRPTGTVVTEWMEINHKWYYFVAPYGYMISGTSAVIDGVRYYFTASGARAGAGWQSESFAYNGENLTVWHYTDAKGIVQTGWKQIKNKWYYFADSVPVKGMITYTDGAMAFGGLYEIDGKYEYFDANGVWIRMTDSSSWRRDGSRLRYCKSDGTFATGWLTLDGKKYFFDSSGYLKTGWVKSGGKWYYCDPAAEADNVIVVNENRYLFDAGGVMQTGDFVKLEFEYNDYRYTYWFSAEADGSLYIGWKNIGDKYYFFRPAMAVDGWYQIGDYYYEFDADGAWTGGVSE